MRRAASCPRLLSSHDDDAAMIDHSYDWILTGLSLDLMGGLVLAKGFILKGLFDAYREAQPRMGVNSFAVRSAIFQKTEAVIGGGLLALGFALQMFGNFHGAPASNSLGSINSAERLALLVVMSAGLAAVSVKVGHAWARRRFFIYFLRHWSATSAPLTHTEEELDALGSLYELTRLPSEDDDGYRRRLEARRTQLGTKYAGRERVPLAAKE